MPPGVTVDDIAQRIQLLRAEQVAWQGEVRNAEELEVEALHAEQAARDCQVRAQRCIAEGRRAYHDLAVEIDVLVDEWRNLIPEQRQGG